MWKFPGIWQFAGQEKGYKSLSGELTTDWLNAKIRLQVAKDTVRRMLEMHNRRLAFETFTIDDIFIQPAEKVSVHNIRRFANVQRAHDVKRYRNNVVTM